MSDNKQPAFSLAPPSENKTASATFGQPSSTTASTAFGATSGPSATTSSSPFGAFGNTSSTSGTPPFATAFSQGSSAFGGQPKSSPFNLGGPPRLGSTASPFSQKSDPSVGQPSPSIFNSNISSTSPAIGGAQSNSGSGSPFGNLASTQPGNISAGLSTPASSKTPFSFSGLSTTPAGPPPSATNGSSAPPSGGFFFAKPQQPGSAVFSPKSDAPASTQPTSALTLTSNSSNSSGDGPKSAASFGSQPSADGKLSGQSSGSAFGAPATGNRLGMLARNEGTQTSPGLFGEFNKPQANPTQDTASSPFSFPTSTSGSGTNAQQTQQNQPDGVPTSTPQTLTTGAASTSTPQAATFNLSGAGKGLGASQSAPPRFMFRDATGNPPQPAVTSEAAGAQPGTEAPQSAKATFTLGDATSSTGNPSQPAAASGAAGATSSTGDPSRPATTSAAPVSTAAEISTLEKNKPPGTSAAASSDPATSAPAADAAQTSNANLGASTGPPPPPQSRLKNKSMEEIITSWAKDLGEYQKEFQKQADKIASWDQLIVENGEKIQKLYASTFEAERASSEVERQLSAVVSQQDELSGWLDRYEKEVDEIFSRQVGQGEGLQGPDQERERTYKLAEKLSDRLDEMGKDLKSMIEEINSASLTLNKTNKPDDPLSQIVKILNSHLASLQWIDQNAAAIQAKVSAAQKVGQGLGANGHRGLGDDAVDDFYRSYLGRR